MLENRQFLFQCLFFSGLQSQLFHLLCQLLHLLPPVRLFLFQLYQMIQPLCRLLQGAESFLVRLEQRIITAESVQNFQMALRCQKHLIVMLSVNVD